jgi:hypothetical protein
LTVLGENAGDRHGPRRRHPESCMSIANDSRSSSRQIIRWVLEGWLVLGVVLACNGLTGVDDLVVDDPPTTPSSTCSDECEAGGTRCAQAKAETCGNYDNDSCLEWGNPVVCPLGCGVDACAVCAPEGARCRTADDCCSAARAPAFCDGAGSCRRGCQVDAECDRCCVDFYDDVGVIAVRGCGLRDECARVPGVPAAPNGDSEEDGED